MKTPAVVFAKYLRFPTATSSPTTMPQVTSLVCVSYLTPAKRRALIVLVVVMDQENVIFAPGRKQRVEVAIILEVSIMILEQQNSTI